MAASHVASSYWECRAPAFSGEPGAEQLRGMAPPSAVVCACTTAAETSCPAASHFFGLSQRGGNLHSYIWRQGIHRSDPGVVTRHELKPVLTGWGGCMAAVKPKTMRLCEGTVNVGTARVRAPAPHSMHSPLKDSAQSGGTEKLRTGCEPDQSGTRSAVRPSRGRLRARGMNKTERRYARRRIALISLRGNEIQACRKDVLHT